MIFSLHFLSTALKCGVNVINSNSNLFYFIKVVFSGYDFADESRFSSFLLRRSRGKKYRENLYRSNFSPLASCLNGTQIGYDGLWFPQIYHKNTKGMASPSASNS